MNLFNQMMNGKSREEQIQTLLNSAQNRGMDINQKIFSQQDVNRLFGTRNR